MKLYLHKAPGVYGYRNIQELTKNYIPSGTAVAGMAAAFDKGPIGKPILIPAVEGEEYAYKIFGRPSTNTDGSLFYKMWVDAGGGDIYLLRIANDDFDASTSDVMDTAGTPALAATISAKSVGVKGDNISYDLEQITDSFVTAVDGAHDGSEKYLKLDTTIGLKREDVIDVGSDRFIVARIENGTNVYLKDTSGSILTTIGTAIADDAVVNTIKYNLMVYELDEYTSLNNLVESFYGLSLNPNNAKYIENINDEAFPASAGKSNLIKIELEATTDVETELADVTDEGLSGGADGALIIDDYEDFSVWDKVFPSFLMYPGANFANAALIKKGVAYCQERLDIQVYAFEPDSMDFTEAATTTSDELVDYRMNTLGIDTPFAYMTASPVIVEYFETDTQITPKTKVVSGLPVIMAKWKVNDETKGYQHAPAGAHLKFGNEIKDIVYDWSGDNGDQAKLNPVGINVIRYIDNIPTLWSERTLSTDPRFKHLSIQRWFTEAYKFMYRACLKLVFDNEGEQIKMAVSNAWKGYVSPYVKGNFITEENIAVEFVEVEGDVYMNVAIEAKSVKPVEFINIEFSVPV